MRFCLSGKGRAASVRAMKRGLPALAAAAAVFTMSWCAPAGAYDAGFRQFVEGLWPAVAQAKIKRTTFERGFAGVDEPDPADLKLASNQPEFTSTTSQYLLKAVPPACIETGKAMLREKAGLLAALETRYGVDRHILLAFWGMESNFGKDKGSMG